MNDINRSTLKKQQFIFINLIKFNWAFTTAICPPSSILESFFIDLYFSGDLVNKIPQIKKNQFRNNVRVTIACS